MNGVLARVTNKQAAQVGPTTIGNYGTINNSIGIAEACKLAIDAGADILLMPSDVPAAIDAVVDGVREGRFSQARVDSSVRRVLEIKRQLNLDRRRLVSLDSVRALVGDTANLSLAAAAAQRSITLAKDSLNLVPFARRARRPRVRCRSRSPTRTDLPAGATFNAELRRGIPALRTELINPDDAVAELRASVCDRRFGRMSRSSDRTCRRGRTSSKSERAGAARAVHARSRAASSAHDARGVRKSISAPTGAGGVDVRRRMGRIPGFSDGRGRSLIGAHADHRPPADHHSSPVAFGA